MSGAQVRQAVAGQAIRPQAVLCVLGAGGLIYLLQGLNLLMPWKPGQFTPIGLVFPMVLTFLLLSRRGQWPWIAAASLAGVWLAAVTMGGRPLVSLGVAACGIGEALACAMLLVRGTGRTPDLTELPNIGRYLLIAAACSCVGAVAAGSVEWLVGGARFWPNALIWATREFAGMATLTPCIFVVVRFRSSWRLLAGPNAWPFAVLLAAEAIVFFQDRMPLTYLVVAPLLLVTWRMQILGAAVGVLITMAAALAGTLMHHGPFAQMPGSQTERLLALQLFLAVCFHLSVPVAAATRRARELQEKVSEALEVARDSEARYRLVTENTRDIVVHFDREATIRYVSPSCRVIGYEPEEMIGRKSYDFLHPDQVDKVRANTEQLLAGIEDPARDRRFLLRRKDGSYCWYEGSPNCVRDETGAVVGIVNVVRDINAQRAAAEALAASETRYRLLADNMRDIVVQLDVEGRIQYVSPSCRALGYEPEDLIGRDRSEFIHAEEVPRLLDNMRLLRTGMLDRSRDRTHRIRVKGGGYRWFEGIPSPITDENGVVVGVVNVMRDVHEAKAAVEALGASEARYRLLADNMTDIVACYGRDGVLTFVSGATRETLGYEAAALIGVNIESLMHPDDAAIGRKLFQRRVDEGPGARPFRFEYRLRRKDGAYVWLEAHPQAHHDPEGRFVEWQDSIRDISEHKALEEQLRAARRTADAAAKTKAEFLADMSHELRGPLNSVIGFARLARGRPGVTGPVRTYLQRIEDASLDLIEMVSDILEFSKLEAAEVVFRPRATAVSELARAATGLLEPPARGKDLDLVLNDRTPAGLVVSLDDGRVRQVLVNLLDNAVKFTHAGSVTLELQYDAATERLSAEVRDTGPGIPADRIGRLFHRFTQADEGGERSYAGAGLGLAICKGLVEGLGGEISARSKVGQGSAFSFWVPAPQATGPAESAEEPGPRFRVLVADGDADTRALVAQTLSRLNAEVLGAADGEAALKLASREALDVIVTDLDLPKVSGRAALRRLRSGRGRNSATPVLAFTNRADDGLYAQVLEEGFQGLITKPFSPSELVSAIAHAVAVGAKAA